MNELFQWIVNIFKDARFWQLVLPWERAVRVRFGRWVRLWEPGLHPRIPFFDEVRVINTRLRVATVPGQTLMTTDHKPVTVAANVGFRISDPLAAIMKIQQPENVTSAFAQRELAKAIQSNTLAEIQPFKIEMAALDALAREFNEYGLEFEFVSIVEFAAVRTFRLLNDTWRPNTGHGEVL